MTITACVSFVRRAALALLVWCAAGVAPLNAQPADTVLVNGRIATQGESSSVVEALAIRDGKIAATGRSEEMRAYAGPGTRVIDLAGRTVIPGLIDSHIHAIRAGVHYADEVSWIGAKTIAEALGRIRAVAQANPNGWIIVAGGWTPQQFAEARRPTAAEIVAAAPDHAIYVQFLYRAAFLSPVARDRLGIHTEEDLPPGGKIEHDEDGSPTGWIAGGWATIVALYARLPGVELSEAVEGTRRFFRELNRLGLTGVIDPGGHNLAPQEYAALFRLWHEDGLTLRVRYSIFAPRRGHELEDFQTFTRFLPMGTGDDMLRFNGIGECVTWGMYNNDTPSEEQKDEFFRVARWAAQEGMTVTVHWLNDRSVHHLLDVLERVNHQISIAPLRWSVAHVHDASEGSLTRMKELGVGWLMQDVLYFAAPAFLAERGPARRAHMPSIRTALRLGLPTGGGTDANRVMNYNPFVSLRWMLDGRTVDGIETRVADEIPSREEALRIYTQGSAWFAHEETRRGALVPGQLADLAVLTEDYFSVPVAQIAAIESVLTMVGGRVVYAARPYAGLEADGVK
jgi:predicted amidohydrolase YtcJ